MSWASWHTLFAARRDRALPSLAEAARGLGPREVAALAHTLAVFQLGETGEGRVVHEVLKAGLAGVDEDYRSALALFVREEGRHSRILLAALAELGAEPLRDSPAAVLFRRSRRLLGVRLELLVLLAAEVIACGFYATLADHLPDGPLAAALRGICEDEEDHLAFHAELFRAQAADPVRRALFVATWRSVCGAACTTVLVDHGETLDALGASRTATALLLAHHAARVEALVCGPPARRTPAASIPLSLAS